MTSSGLILGWRPANEKRRYIVTTSLIGWAQVSNQPCILNHFLYMCQYMCQQFVQVQLKLVIISYEDSDNKDDIKKLRAF